jgi:PAT family beta-lactamase induction signal transducer AmpG
VNVLSASGGYLADALGWTPFFLLSTVLCLPGLALLAWIMRHPPDGRRPGVQP